MRLKMYAVAAVPADPKSPGTAHYGAIKTALVAAPDENEAYIAAKHKLKLSASAAAGYLWQFQHLGTFEAPLEL